MNNPLVPKLNVSNIMHIDGRGWELHDENGIVVGYAITMGWAERMVASTNTLRAVHFDDLADKAFVKDTIRNYLCTKRIARYLMNSKVGKVGVTRRYPLDIAQ